MSPRPLTLLVACISAAAVYASPVAAQGAEAVRLEIEDCAGVAGNEVRALVALELAPRAVLATDARTTAAVRGGITCQHETARIWVKDPARASALQLDITLRDLAPRARPRLLALALSELIATSRMQRSPQPSAAGTRPVPAAPTHPSTRPLQTAAREQRAQPLPDTSLGPSAGAQTVSGTAVPQAAHLTQPSAASANPTPATAPMADASTRHASLQASLAVGTSTAAAPATASAAASQPSFLVWLGAGVTRAAKPTLWAPAVSAGAVQTWDQLAIFVDVRVEVARRSKNDLQLGLEGLSLALGPAWHVTGARNRWLLGPAVRAGYVRLHATASDTNLLGRALPGFWLGPCVQTALHLGLSESWAMRFGVELGYLTQTVRGHDASGAPLLALEGAWLSAHAALSWGAARSTP